MLRFFYRHPFLLYLLFLLPALLAVFRLGLFPHHLLYAELLAALLPVLLALLLYIPLMFHLNSSSLQAWNDGDPEPLLTHSLDGIKLYRRSWNAPSKKALCGFHINASAALASLGRFSEALEHLDEAAALPLTEECAVLLWLNRSAVFYNLKDPEAMAHCLSMAEQALASLKPARRALCASALEQNRLAHRLLTEGPGPEVEAGYQELLAASRTTREKVSRHFALAQCALARDDRAAAREHLEYVVAHGNKLHARAQAIRLWEEQGFPPSTEPPA